MKECMDGTQFSKLFASGAACICNAKQECNELNVFPVPDGDTGTNMSMTMDAGVKELRPEMTHVGQAVGVVAQGLLRGARGNSGVILSLLFRGFAKSVKELETVDGLAFAMAMSEGVDTAYRAVMKPAEGTVLTVSRVSARHAVEYAATDSDLERVIIAMLAKAEEALTETVHQNPVLEKAGVVDAGGYGFCLILRGMLLALQGNPVKREDDTGTHVNVAANFADFSGEDILFGYCTEFIIKRVNNKKDSARLQAFLETCGDSLVFVEDETIIKVHVHTDNPGRVLAQAISYGELTAIKVENMREQHTEQIIKQDTQSPKPVLRVEPQQQEEEYGFVGVCAGAGLAAVLRDLGVAHIVEGGQTMNPSTQEILDCIKNTNAKTIFVLPNNKNIIMAAEQCIPLTEKTVVVIPSKNVPQGITAMLNFDPEQDVETNRQNMTSAMDTVTSALITVAARDSQFDGNDITEGDHMALINGALASTHPLQSAVLEQVGEQLEAHGPSFVTVYFGEGVEETLAQAAAGILQSKLPEATVQVIDGGQPVYSFIISAE